jgi:hypothetical protein
MLKVIIVGLTDSEIAGCRRRPCSSSGSPLRGSFCSPSRDASRSPLRRAPCTLPPCAVPLAAPRAAPLAASCATPLVTPCAAALETCANAAALPRAALYVDPLANVAIAKSITPHLNRKNVYAWRVLSSLPSLVPVTHRTRALKVSTALASENILSRKK